jgi:hypothetical protein
MYLEWQVWPTECRPWVLGLWSDMRIQVLHYWLNTSRNSVVQQRRATASCPPLNALSTRWSCVSDILNTLSWCLRYLPSLTLTRKCSVARSPPTRKKASQMQSIGMIIWHGKIHSTEIYIKYQVYRKKLMTPIPLHEFPEIPPSFRTSESKPPTHPRADARRTGSKF